MDERKRVYEVTVALFGPEIPCSDGGCVFGHPGGMHTNGGCQHLKIDHKYENRRIIQMLAAVARHLAKEPHV